MSQPPSPYLIVALEGNNGKLGWSDNGIVWHETTALIAGASFYFVAALDSTYWVAGGPTGTWKSLDGLGWAAITPGLNGVGTWAAIKFGGKYYMSSVTGGGGAAKVFRISTDLITWSDPVSTNASFGSAVGAGIYAMETDGSILVCAGQTDVLNITSAYLAWSSDGSTWTACTIPANHENSMRCLVYAASLGIWVCGGSTNGGGFWSSADGKTWTQRTSPFAPTSANCAGMAWCASLALFVAVGEVGQVATSTNGTTWTLRTGAHGTSTIYGVTWAPALNLFVAVGASAKVSTSPDGTNWTLRSPGWTGGATDGEKVRYSLLPSSPDTMALFNVRPR